jgi:hypothetical protein
MDARHHVPPITKIAPGFSVHASLLCSAFAAAALVLNTDQLACIINNSSVAAMLITFVTDARQWRRAEV